VRTADCIHMLDQGRIVESGSHEALMGLLGHCARMAAPGQAVGANARKNAAKASISATTTVAAAA
jgi:ABC-type transport system involved in cytochrome bd biosynthesis fused ATPase/permease subunit